MAPSRRRRILALLGLAAGAALAAIALGWFPEEPVRRRVEERLRAWMGPEARLGRLSIQPARLRATAENLVIEGPAYRLEADHVELALAPATLRGSTVHLRELRARGVRLTLRPAPSASAAATATDQPPLWIDALAVEGGRVRYHDPALEGDVVLDGVSLTGSIGGGGLDLAARGGSWERRPAVALGPLRARLRVDPKLVTQVDSFEAGLARSRVQAAGALGPLLDPSPDLRLQATLDLGELGPLGGLARTQGVVRVEGSAKAGETLRLDATASAEALRVEGWPVERARLRIGHDAGETSASLEAALLDGRASGEGRWDGQRFTSRLQLAELSLGRLRREGLLDAEGLEARVQADLELAGTRERAQLAAQAQVSGRLQDRHDLALRAKARGPISLADSGMDLAWEAAIDARGEQGALRGGHLDLAGSARGRWPPRVEATASGTLEAAAGERLLALRPTATLRVEGGRYAVEATVAGLSAPVHLALAGRGNRFERLSSQADGVEVEALLPGARGRATWTAAFAGPVSALDGTASLQVAQAAWRETALGSATVELALRRGRAEAMVAVPDLRARAALALPPGARAVIEGTIDLEDTPLAPFAPLLPPAAAGLEGAVRAHAALTVPLATPDRATVRAEVASLQVERGRWSARAAAPFQLGYAAGEVTVGALQVEGEGLRLEADGRVGTGPGGRLDLRLRARSALEDVVVPEGWELAGAADADLALTGSLKRPEARGQVALHAVRLSGPSLPALAVDEGRLDLDGASLVLPAFTVGVAGGRVTLDGRIPLAAALPGARRAAPALSPGEEARVVLEWAEIDAATLLAQVSPGQGTGLDARLAGRAEIEGGLASLGEPAALVQLPSIPARFQELPLTLEAASVRLRAGTVSTAGLRLTTESGSLEIVGSADLVQRRADVTGQGQIALRALSPFLQEAALSGSAQLDLQVRGPFDAMRTEGALAIEDATLRMRAIPQAVSGISGLVVFAGDRVEIERAQGSLGGGPLTLAGTARIAGNRLEDARFLLTGRDLALRYPVGLRSRLDADLTLSGGSGALLLAGAVRVQRGIYDMDEALVASTAAAAGESPALRAIALDLVLLTEAPILVRGNIGEMRATGHLTLRGDMETPVPSGSLTIERGGQILLQGQEFDVEEGGELSYAGTWNASLEIDAKREISDRGKGNDRVKVTVSVVGTLDKPTVRLTSEPFYTESEILSLIAVGDSTDRAARLALGTEAAGFLLGTRLSRQLRQLGFDEVSIRPELVARNGETEAEAGARFTFGKRLSNRTRLVYSASLQDPEERYIRLELEPGYNVSLNAQRTDKGNLGTGAGQTFRWGGSRAARASAAEADRQRLADVRVSGGGTIPPEELRRLLKVKPGDRRTIWQLQDDADRLRTEMVRRGFLEADVDARLDQGAAVFQVREGPLYTWQITGMDGPPDLGPDVRQALFAEEALERGRARLLRELRGRGHLRAKVTTEVRAEGPGRLLAFRVEAGPRLSASLSFPGAAAFSPGRLRKIAGGPGRALTEPEEAMADLEAAYLERYYLTVKVEPPRVAEREGRVDIAVPIQEGPPARVGEVRFEGAARPEAELRAAAKLPAGGPYDAPAVLAASDALRIHYFSLGYPAVRIRTRVVPRPPDLDVVFEIGEGPAVRVGQVVVQGATRTRLGLIHGLIRLEPGDPVDPRALNALEKRLLDLGVFSRVAASVSSDNPATVTVTVEEGDRLVGGYAFRYDEKENDVLERVENQARADVDAEVRNLFGRGLGLGGRYGRGTDVEDARADTFLPSFLGQERVGLSVSRLIEYFDPTVEGASRTRREQRIFRLQGQSGLSEHWHLLYGYRFKRSEVTALDFDIVTDIAGFDLSSVIDTRDNVLDARRGRFFALSLDYAPPALKKLSGNFHFVKGLGTLFLATPLTDSLTWAQGYRLGLAHGFGGEPVLSTERFQAGGANSVRGFATNRLGPLEPTFDGDFVPLGGESVVILNQELRYHHSRFGLGGAVFYDGGNVFERGPTLKLRHSFGFGLRWDSPVGLLRVDLGFPLHPQKDRNESRHQLFLSIGQAF